MLAKSANGPETVAGPFPSLQAEDIFTVDREDRAEKRGRRGRRVRRVRKRDRRTQARWIDRSRRNRDYTIVGSSILPGWSSLPIKSASGPSQSVSTPVTGITLPPPFPPPPVRIRRRNNIVGCYDNRAASRRIAPHRAKPPRKLALLHHNDFSRSLSPFLLPSLSVYLSLSFFLVVAEPTKVTPPSVAFQIQNLPLDFGEIYNYLTYASENLEISHSCYSFIIENERIFV